MISKDLDKDFRIEISEDMDVGLRRVERLRRVKGRCSGGELELTLGFWRFDMF
jgi:hypothetical protein